MYRTIHHTLTLATVTLAAAALALAGCGRRDPVTSEAAAPKDANVSTRPTTERAAIQIHREGGFAPSVTDVSVDSASGAFVLVSRRPCSGVPCQAPLDSASGTLARTDVRGLFDLVAARRVFSLQYSYGTAPNARDQYFYETTIRANGAEKKVFADDVTIPQALRDVHDAVFAAIAAARKR